MIDRVWLTCPGCGASRYVADWDYGDDYTCHDCGKSWETDYDESEDVGLIGPWVTSKQVPTPDPG